MDDEPLSEWAERRDAKIGRLRAVPLASGDGPKGSHLNPDAPRAIQRWNGHSWEPHGFASNLTETKRLLYPEASEPPASGRVPRVPKPPGSGTGRHRNPRRPGPTGLKPPARPSSAVSSAARRPAGGRAAGSGGRGPWAG
ncbi:DUF6087 family protein [Streptomyces sp. NPDC050433]|uniref:DUF6087 family protein n=1 Tax=Streptomyces sp. NPDC050433 TaxID=3365615 RepID=UPI0037ADDDA4